MSEGSDPDRDAILGRRALLLATATAPWAAGSARAQGPAPCLSPPRPPGYPYGPALTLVVEGALRDEQRLRIGGLVTLWDTVDRPILWVHAHVRAAEGEAALEAARDRAERVMDELARRGVPRSAIRGRLVRPPGFDVTTPFALRPRGVTIWLIP